jgi:hypothetical protein
MPGRLLAACGWLTWRAETWIASLPFGRRLGSRAVPVLIGVVAVVALAPLVVAYVQPQPVDSEVEPIRLGTPPDGDGWVRLRGRIVALEEPPAVGDGEFGLLIDATDGLEAIVVHGLGAVEPAASTVVTGHLRQTPVTVVDDLPIEATVAGTPPQVAASWLLDLDAEALPERIVLWPISLLGALVIGTLLVGTRAGYPVFRPTREIDVLAQPLAPGDRLPVAVGGRIGPHHPSLADPAGALITVGPGPRGGVLTVQLLGEGRAAPEPVEVGGGWTEGHVGYVHTIGETVPALAVRSERADAVLLFARTGERDRAAALVSVARAR